MNSKFQFQKTTSLATSLAAGLGMFLFMGAAAQAQGGLAEVKQDPNNASLCSMVAPDQAPQTHGLQMLGIRPNDLSLFGRTSKENAALAARYRQVSRKVDLSSHESRLVAHDTCDNMKKFVDALNHSYFNQAKMECQGGDLGFRIRPLGQGVLAEFMQVDSAAKARVVYKRDWLKITDTGSNANGCHYRLTLENANGEEEVNTKSAVQNFKICLSDLDGGSGKLQMTLADRNANRALTCQATSGFDHGVQNLVSADESSSQEAPAAARLPASKKQSSHASTHKVTRVQAVH
jgi:hypothetical protein